MLKEKIPRESSQLSPAPQEQLQAARLEKEIQKALMKHHKNLQRDVAFEQHHPPTPPQPKHDRTQERGISMGF
jgi:hypothetical protein